MANHYAGGFVLFPDSTSDEKNPMRKDKPFNKVLIGVQQINFSHFYMGFISRFGFNACEQNGNLDGPSPHIYLFINRMRQNSMAGYYGRPVVEKPSIWSEDEVGSR